VKRRDRAQVKMIQHNWEGAVGRGISSTQEGGTIRKKQPRRGGKKQQG
jgi:hypothetical protein